MYSCWKILSYQDTGLTIERYSVNARSGLLKLNTVFAVLLYFFSFLMPCGLLFQVFLACEDFLIYISQYLISHICGLKVADIGTLLWYDIF